VERDLSLQEMNNLYGESFCIKPFTEICNTAQGGVGLCCQSRRILTPKEKGNRSLKEVFLNDAKLQQIREDMRAGVSIPACKKCTSPEELTGQSMRYHMNNTMRNKNPELFEDIVNFGKIKLKTLDIKFGNVCNLACVMCDEGSSSLIGLEHKQYKVPALLDHSTWSTSESNDPLSHINNFNDSELEQLKDLVHDITRFKTTGGEPMLLPGFKTWLEFLVESGHSQHIEFVVTTNGTVDATPFVHLMSQFKSFRLLWSIDAVDKTLGYVRYPATFSKLTRNHKSLCAAIISNGYQDNVKVSFSTVAHALNAHCLVDVARYADSLGIISNIAYDIVFYPVGINPGVLHADTLAQIQADIAAYDGKFKEQLEYIQLLLVKDYNNVHNDPIAHQNKLQILKHMTDYWANSRKLAVTDYVQTYEKTMSQLE
jgi:hypothetical protein